MLVDRRPKGWPSFGTASTGAARLSSARALRCSLKWVNERNPYRVLQVSHETAPPKDRNPAAHAMYEHACGATCDCDLWAGRKEGMMSNQRGPLIPWATHMIQWYGQWAAKPQGGANPIKPCPSSDWGLQLAPMKPELLVIADQHAAVNTFSSLVLTARQCKGAGSG